VFNTTFSKHFNYIMAINLVVEEAGILREPPTMDKQLAIYFSLLLEGLGGSMSPIWLGFAPGFVNNKKGCTRLASNKICQLLVHGRWFSEYSGFFHH
jgi:hypothetical protein